MRPSARTADPVARLFAGIGATLRAGASALIARVHEAIRGHPTQDADDIAGMSVHMLRDIGAESSVRSRAPGRGFEYPRT
ncbi:MAG TPA: hypothetical protein VFF44_07205 [Casimicrobiaceae bacterium]|nr:hypothetical protein [Casimicrobiaceae bacterium]